MPYTLTVKPRKNRSFDYTVSDESGTVVDTRNSFRRYVSATIARWNLARELSNARFYIGNAGYDQVWAQAKVAKVEAMAARGEQFPAFALSFNSKPTKLTARQAQAYDFLGFAMEDAQAQAVALQGVKLAPRWSVSIPGIGHPADTFAVVASTVKQAKDKARELYIAKHGVRPQALHTSKLWG